MELRSRREPCFIGDEPVLLAGLRRAMKLPEAVARLLKRAKSSGEPLAPLLANVFGDPTLARPEAEEQVFPLQEYRRGGFTNSVRGQAYLERYEGPLTVLDALHLEEFARFPREGGFLFLGDGQGGFFAPRICYEEIPCGRCLLLRYLAGRQASPLLYRALHGGTRVAFHNAPKAQGLEGEAPLTCFGEHARSWDSVLPLPDCRWCWNTRSVEESLVPGVFSPVARLVSLMPHHAAHLPQMLWLTGEETVGGGGAYDHDQQRGELRACHEALERYAAHFVPPAATSQGVVFQSRVGPRTFPRKRTLLTEPGSVSTGLACHDDLETAIEHGLAEVCERDALARFWLGLCQGKARVALLEKGESDEFSFQLLGIDSYHLPVVICLGTTRAGQTVTGTAGGFQAPAKALAECRQNAAFLRTYGTSRPPSEPETFADHAALYWHRFRKWPSLQGCLLEQIVPRTLQQPVYHCDLTPTDLRWLGKHVVRVLVPGLLHLPMSHHDWPTVLKEAAYEAAPPSQPHPFL